MEKGTGAETVTVTGMGKRAETGKEGGAETRKRTETGKETEMETGTGTDMETRRETEAGTGTDMETRRETETGTGTDMETRRETEARTGADMETGKKTEKRTEAGRETTTEMKTGKGAEVEMEEKEQIKMAMEVLKNFVYGLAVRAGESQEHAETLWQGICGSQGLLRELAYYHDYGKFLCEYQVAGCTLADVVAWQVDHFKLYMDRPEEMNRYRQQRLLLAAFDTMVEMERDPKLYLEKMRCETGQDILG